MTPLDTVLDRLSNCRKTPIGYSARCPAHDDKSPSLSIAEGNDGRVLLHCWAGCNFRDIMTAIGLTEADAFVGQRSSRSRKYPNTRQIIEEVNIVRVYEAMREAGKSLSEADTARYELALKRLQQSREANNARF